MKLDKNNIIRVRLYFLKTPWYIREIGPSIGVHIAKFSPEQALKLGNKYFKPEARKQITFLLGFYIFTMGLIVQLPKVKPL